MTHLVTFALAADLGPGGDASGSALASWQPLTVLLVIFGLVVTALLIGGRAPATSTGILDRTLLRIPDALERVAKIPGWAAATVGTGLFGLLVAGQGFYSDVAWHIALGRDDELFTAPHMSILIGLVLIASAAALGILFATLGRVDVGLRWGGLRIPWSTIPLGALGVAAVSGFPIDEVWHGAYGIDVTMWSPPHMVMILGASFTGLAAWLVLAEAGVPLRGGSSRWHRGIHVVGAWLTLQGLSAAQGEFAFGVPQFQQLFLPILLCLAAGIGLTAIRLILGRGWAIGVAVGSLLLSYSGLLSFGAESEGGGPVPTRDGGLYVAAALAVELAAWLVGTERRLRFALVSGLGVGTIGLAGEWAWNADWALSDGGYQPWNTSLLPEAAIYGLVAALAGAVIGAALAGAVRREGRAGRVPTPALVLAGLAALATIALPMPRPVGDVVADLRLTDAGDGEASIEVILTPADAADDARWFQAINWQGGELVIAEMERKGEGRYVSERPITVEGRGKTLLRLHRGSEMMAVPVRLPADPEIGEPEIPAVDRVAPFVSEQQYLLREQTDGVAWVSWAVHGLAALAAMAWVTAFVVAAKRIGDLPPGPVHQREPAASDA
ncbi:MAG TPA: hypothetical protein VMN58_02680 [Acidimicrobiales bacterium]|nr:hypothetical protein [Acidimicrobiales bacterium]